MFQYAVVLSNKSVIIFDEDSNILYGEEYYKKMDENSKKFISPDFYMLSRALQKGIIRTFTVREEQNG